MKLRNVTIQQFRGIKNLSIDLEDTTVLIGENNSGKTAVLDAIRTCLTRVRSARGFAFDTYDLHLEDAAAEPTTAGPIVLTLLFREDDEDEWSRADLQALNNIVVDHQDRYQVTLRVEARYDSTAGQHVQEIKFLDGDGNPMPTPPAAISTFQDRIRCFYLPALRDAGTHFGATGQFWRPFLKDSQFPAEKKKEIEGMLEQVNKEVVASHGSFKKAMDVLTGIQDVLPLASGDIVSVEAVPGRILDMLSRARVNLSGITGARIPVDRHGEGTQSLSVLMLFRAFVDAWPQGHPIVALEEPEAHLHPSAIRALWAIVESLPGQKLISTHSGDLLSEVPVQALRRLSRGPTGIEARRLKPGTLDPVQAQKFDFHVRQSRGELLFARCWLLVELVSGAGEVGHGCGHAPARGGGDGRAGHRGRDRARC